MGPKIFQAALEDAVSDIASKAQMDDMTVRIAMVEYLLACLQQSPWMRSIFPFYFHRKNPHSHPAQSPAQHAHHSAPFEGRDPAAFAQSNGW